MRHRPTRVRQIPLFDAERSQVRRLIPATQHFCSTLKCFSPHSHAVSSQGFILAEQEDHERKEVYNSKQFVSFLWKWTCFSLSNQIYSSAECFGGVSGAACLSVYVISYTEVKNWWEVNSQKPPPHPPPLSCEGVNNAFGVIYLK